MIPHFIYYIRGLKAGAETKPKIHKIVGPAIHGCDLVCSNVDSGPGENGPGILVAAIPEGRDAPPGDIAKGNIYCPDPMRQEWVEGAGFWCGFHVDAKPSAEDLTRSMQVRGYPHNCEESGEWIVPMARKADGSTLFDQRIMYRADGEIEMRPLKRYEALCAFAEEHYTMLSGIDLDTGELLEKVDRRFADVAVQALAINYHVGPTELSMLGALTIQTAFLICGYLCDWPALVAIHEGRKKKEQTEQ